MKTMNSSTKFWMIVASKDHVKKGIAEGIAQACHGKASPLKRMKPGDGVIYYSGKQSMDKPDKCREFTAIGYVNDDEVYTYQMTPDFCPFRRNISFLPHTDVSILPLVDDLQFIKNKKRWGYPFRFGFFEISQYDFDLIASHMLLLENA